MTTIKYSVTVPIFNELENITELIDKIEFTMNSLGEPWELILVDDGSTDGSFARIKELAAYHANLRGLKFSKNNGQTAAMAAGIKAARGEIIITLDADLQNDPADIPLLLEKLNEGYEAAVGWRVNRKDNLIRRISSKIANSIRNFVSDENIQDTGCSLKAFKASSIQSIELFEGMHRFLPTLVKLNGGRVIEVKVSHYPRLKGMSKYNIWNRIWRSFLDLLAIRWMKWRKLRYEIVERV